MYEYPFGNGQQLNLDWFLNEWKNLLAAWEAEKNGIEGALQAEIDRAEAALADVFAARDAAAQSAANALESKNAAAQSASDASGYLATVRADANTAHNAAQNAAQSESDAAESAQTALASKNAAGQSERNAAQSEANANSSKNAAAQSERNAAQSASAAADSQTAAGNSADAAAQSAEDAEDAASSVEESAQQIANNTLNINDLIKQIPTDEMQGRGFRITDGAENLDIIGINGDDGTQYAILGEHLPFLENLNNTTVGSDGSSVVANDYRLYKIDVTNIDTLYMGVYRTAVGNRVMRCWGYDANDKPVRSLFGYTGASGAIRSANVSDITFVRLGWANNVNFIAFSGKGNISTVPNIVKTFKGENNIISPSASIDLVYRCDIEAYIEKKLSEIQATLLENVGG